MVAKLSSVRIIVAASLVTSVPVTPIATPMSALRRAGRVVDPVAGHRDDVAAGLQRAHDPDLVLGGDAGDHADVVEPAGEVGVVVAIRSSSAPVTARPGMPRSAAMAPAVTAWSPVIMRTRMPASRHWAIAVAGLGPGWIDDADERDQDDPVEQVLRVVGGLEASAGKSWAPIGEHPHALLGQLGVAARVALPHGVVEGQDLGAAEVAVGPAGEHVRGAFDEAAHHVAARCGRSSGGRWP